MERTTGHTPKDSITDPAAEEAHRHLSWSPGDEESQTEYEERVAEFEHHDFVSYTGFPDGTFEVTVNLGRERVVAVQTERGTGDIREAFRTACEKADLALAVLTFTPEDEALSE